MRTTQYFLSTLKETPRNVKTISHQLMLRSGMIRKLAPGLYTWLPTGLRVLTQIKKIIREEMNECGALEIIMPIIQPAKLWEQSGRWKLYGEELLKIFDRNKKIFILAPTHEEVITQLIHKEINSLKKLPLLLYQIQTKFRDEIRPCLGVIRTREFIMKDAYSFHINQNSLKETYDIIHATYEKIFSRMQLNFRSIKADSGLIGGNISHEFHALCKNGENSIAFSTKSNFASNIHTAIIKENIELLQKKIEQEAIKIKQKEKKNKIEILKSINNIHLNKIIKTFLVKASKNSNFKFIIVLIRGDHQLNEIKLEKNSLIFTPLTFITEKEIISILGKKTNNLGPMGFNFPLIADISAVKVKNFTIGANNNNQYFTNINWGVDLPIPKISDIRNVVNGDKSPDGNGVLKIKKSIEIGHIFQLEEKYSKIMNTYVKIQKNQQKFLNMGCYGIGITRLIAAIIEQNHDKYGIIWPNCISPFQLVIIPINIEKFSVVKNTAENLYKIYKKKGIRVLFDDRNERPGVIFSEMDLIGIPHKIIISEKHLKENNVEYQNRSTKENNIIKLQDIVKFICKQII